jgi:hypothetical protein
MSQDMTVVGEGGLGPPHPFGHRNLNGAWSFERPHHTVEWPRTREFVRGLELEAPGSEVPVSDLREQPVSKMHSRVVSWPKALVQLTVGTAVVVVFREDGLVLTDCSRH